MCSRLNYQIPTNFVAEATRLSILDARASTTFVATSHSSPARMMANTGNHISSRSTDKYSSILCFSLCYILYRWILYICSDQKGELDEEVLFLRSTNVSLDHNSP